jgi:TolB protein
MRLVRSLPVAVVAACGSSPRPPVPVAATSAEPEVFAPGVVSTEHSEIRLALSPDGALAIWGSTNRPGGPGGWDLWVSRADGAGGWGTPAPAPFDSDANDFDPAFSADGAYVYFFSNRPGGAGGDDLYRVPVAADGAFGAAQNLGPSVNTPADEWAPAPAPDGSGLLYATSAPGARHDLYVARADGAGFAAGAPLPGAVNTTADELDATYLADGATIVFSRSTDVENDPILLYVARRAADGTYDAGTALPDSINVPGGYTLGPSIDPRDPGVLYLSSKRAATMDIFRVRYAP